MNLPPTVKIVEVGPRDGLQNEQKAVPIEIKVELINRLAKAGLKSIEVGSFVSPKWVPQMASSDEVYRKTSSLESVDLPLLVPNMKGFEAALENNVKSISVFTAASDAFAKKNTNVTVDESLERLREVCTAATASNMRIRGYVSCVLGCPYEGDVDVQKVVDVSKALVDMGCAEISLGDTIGVGTPGKVETLINAITTVIEVEKLAVHFHDTYGQALANILSALQMGVSVIDSSVGGLGGCPYAKGASGNVATEDVLYMLHGMGIETGTDLDSVIAAGNYISDYLGRKNASKVAQAKG